jgi:hypothetical protein
MNARTGAEAITTRIGALAFPLGVILLVVSTIVHPGGEVMNNPVIFRVYAEKDSWIAVHFGQWFGGLLFHYGKVRIGGCRDSALRLCRGGADVGRYHDPTSRRRRGAQVGGGCLGKRSRRRAEVDRVWPAELLEHPAGTHPYPLWAGHRVGHRLPPLARVGSRGLWSRMDRPRTDGVLHRLIHGAPRGVALILMYLWAFVMAFVMWRNGGRQRIARPGSATVG